MFASTLGGTIPADGDTLKPKSFWDNTKGELKLGVSDFSGNTNKTDAVYDLKFKKSWTKNSLTFGTGGVYSKSNSIKIQEKYFGSVLDELTFHKRIGAYTKYSFLRDQFAGYDWVNQIGLGALFTIAESENLTIKARLGYEYRTENYTDPEQSDNAANTGKAGMRAEWSVMTNVKLAMEANGQYDFADSKKYFADGFARFVFNVNKLIDIEIGYSLDFKNTPPEGKVRLDRRFDSTVKIKF
jgi:putative salt-induced outer membrane protein YdiY